MVEVIRLQYCLWVTCHTWPFFWCAQALGVNWRKEQRTKTLWFLDKVTFIAKLFIYFEVKVAQLCPSLLDPMDYSLQPPLSMEILQARILEWVSIPFSRGSSWLTDQTWVSGIAGRFTIWATRESGFTLTLWFYMRKLRPGNTIYLVIVTQRWYILSQVSFFS